jgi:hypothetical protein
MSLSVQLNERTKEIENQIRKSLRAATRIKHAVTTLGNNWILADVKTAIKCTKINY